MSGLVEWTRRLLVAALVLGAARSSSSSPGTPEGRAAREKLLAENEMLKVEARALAEALSEAPGAMSFLEERAPTIKCEDFMTGALKECRDAHVSCVQRAFESSATKQTARAIRRAALDAKSMEEQQDEDQRNIQPQDMTPLQRRQAFAKDNGVATTPFVELKPTDHIKSTENAAETNIARGTSNSGSQTEAMSKTLEALSKMKERVSFRGRGSTQLVESPFNRNDSVPAEPAHPMPSLDAPSPRVLALQEKMRRELSTRLSRERNEESMAERGELGAYTNAVQALQNAMHGKQTEFGRSADGRLKDEAQNAINSYGNFVDAPKAEDF